MREAQIERRTGETRISIRLKLDGSGRWEIDTGIGFFDHMLSHIAAHGMIDLEVRAQGDLHVDAHHTVEDVGIALGQALRQALGDRAGIARYGQSLLPMDESLALVTLDFSNRGLFVGDLPFASARVGAFDTELVGEFLRALAHHAGLTLHARLICGENTHHQIEALFKALGRALRQAVAIDPARSDAVPSTKGVL
ncbi:MAG TPA: imidazoleglycerol-phosphate dehydratase HisB [Anaerolineae bacterium]|nr:imidazoleglycerol-phosphate dehydratase HisB [Anaerolineae bacterium]